MRRSNFFITRQQWNGMPATDQASADPRLDRRFGGWWESFAAGGATRRSRWRHPIHQTAMHCIGRGHIGCNNPPSGPSPMATRPGLLLTNPPLHATTTTLGPATLSKRGNSTCQTIPSITSVQKKIAHFLFRSKQPFLGFNLKPKLFLIPHYSSHVLLKMHQ